MSSSALSMARSRWLTLCCVSCAASLVWPSAVCWRRSLRRLAREPLAFHSASDLFSSLSTTPSRPSPALLHPFEPQPLPRSNRSQWFEGWFVRGVNHPHAFSWALILGSLRRARTNRSLNEDAPQFDEHILVLAYRDAEGRQATHSMSLGPQDVLLSSRPPGQPSLASPQMKWWSDQHGGIEVSGEEARIDVRIAGGS